VVKEIPEWESDLWTYVSSGEGKQCPLIDVCSIRSNGTWCPDVHRLKLTRLINCDNQFNPNSFRFVERCQGAMFSLIEKLATKQLDEANITSLPVPTELISLADEQRPVEIRYVNLKSYYAAIWRLKDVWVIQLSQNSDTARNRLTLFHEAFHILAHCRSNSLPVFGKQGTRKGCFNELLADYFSICMLVPKNLITTAWSEVNDVDGLATLFNVPKSIIWFRLKELELIN